MEDRIRRPPALPALLAGGFVIAVLVFVFAGPETGRAPPTTTVPFVSTTEGTTSTTTTAPEPAPIVEVVPGWALLDGGPLSPRTQAAMAWTGRELIVVGGATESGVFTDAASYHAQRGVWERIPAPPISGGLDPVAVWTGREVIVVTLRETVAYSPDEGTWRVTAVRPDDVRHPVGALWTGSEVVVIAHSQDQSRLLDQLVAVAYDPESDTWRRLPDPPEELSYASVFLHDGRVVLVGGFLDASNRARSDDGMATAQVLDLTAEEWTVLGGLDLSPNAVVATTTDGGILAWDYLLEARILGSDGDWQETASLPLVFEECYPETAAVGEYALAWYCGRAALYSPDAKAWARVMAPPTFDPEVFVPSTHVTTSDGAMFFWGGDWDGIGGPFLWRFRPDGVRTAWVRATDVGSGWSVPFVPEMAQRSDPTLVWTGEELIAWGGHGINEDIFDGFAFDPATGVSHGIPAADYPGRFGQEAVWADGEMYVWRGPISAWDPIRVEWRPLASPGLVATVALVWTGSEVLFIGDAYGGGGLAYDPVTGSWRSLAAPPIATYTDPVVAWSGDELYVWGGVQELVFWEQEGAAYDPDADAWRRLPALPDGLRIEGAVGAWTGEELAIVGVGDPQGNELPHLAGAVFDPASGEWRPAATLPLTALDDEGLAGSLHAVWTGDELAVWLPAPWFGETPQLAFYDPITDRWSLSEHLPFEDHAWDMTFTDDEIAVLTSHGLLLYDVSTER